ncbi:MAG: MFS transporter [Gammaproteobacteria bacterium]|nr:MFS transporter [Gammaproteobacteria bacterium]
MEADAAAVRWNELIRREHLPKLVTLCMSVWLHATNSMLTATTMPSAVDDIGGLHLISWTFALYLAGSISVAASVSMLVARFGLRRSMIVAALVYTGGCIIVATAPTMPILLVGRVLQGLGGGALFALVFVAQDRFFGIRLVPKVMGLVSMVWVLAALSGPAIGGAFANWGLWRLAFWLFALQGLLLAPAIFYLLRGGVERATPAAGVERIPWFRIAFLTGAILLFSLAGADYDPLLSPLMVLAGCLSLAFFIARDRGARASRILPPQATRLHHPIANGIAMAFLTGLCLMSFMVYGPLILIEVYGMNPLQAGFVILVEPFAWSGAAILFSGARQRQEPWIIRTGSALVVLGLLGIAFSFPYGSLWATVAAVVLMNGGMGMMWGFVIKRVIAAVPESEKDRASSMLPITLQTGFALGAAISGLIANGFGLESGSDLEVLRRVCFWLFAGFVPLALVASLCAWRFVDPARAT